MQLHIYVFSIPLSNIRGASVPSNMATAPAPPVHLAFPVAYTAISPATTSALRPAEQFTCHKIVLKPIMCLLQKFEKIKKTVTI